VTAASLVEAHRAGVVSLRARTTVTRPAQRVVSTWPTAAATWRGVLAGIQYEHHPHLILGLLQPGVDHSGDLLHPGGLAGGEDGGEGGHSGVDVGLQWRGEGDHLVVGVGDQGRGERLGDSVHGQGWCASRSICKTRGR
jgi:hypothetical protein